jgi:hypothetical protein
VCTDEIDEVALVVDNRDCSLRRRRYTRFHVPHTLRAG